MKFLNFYYSIIILPVVLLSSTGICQSSIKIDKVNGDVVKGNKNIFIVEKKRGSDIILNANKFLNLNKKIILNIGGNFLYIDTLLLKKGFNPINQMVIGPAIRENIVKLRLRKGRIEITGIFFGFDEKYFAKIENNKLVYNKNFQLYSGGDYYELRDDFDIPILQIKFNKAENSIFFGGVFHSTKGFIIASTSGTYPISYGKEKYSMSLEEKNHNHDLYLKTAREKLKSVHRQN